jgi:hypothetical protein
LRSTALFLFAAFLFFSTMLGENALGHVLFYGLLFGLATNGAGCWAAPVKQDRAASIVVSSEQASRASPAH